MKNAILLHGKSDKSEYYDPNLPSCGNCHWFPWLQQQLMVHDIHTHTPEVPDNWLAEYSTWRREFERYDVTPETTLVGHSCGGGFLVRWLSEHPEQKVHKVVLVAPWLGLSKQLTPELQRNVNEFFDFTIDPDLPARAGQLTIFASDNDEASVTESVEKLRSTLKGAKFREFHNYGHFCYGDMHTTHFPELLEEILG